MMADYHIGVLVGVLIGAFAGAAVSLLALVFMRKASRYRCPCKGRIENWSSRREVWAGKEQK